MIDAVIIGALLAWNIAMQVVYSKREARLLDALMTRTPGEYIAAKRADTPSAPRPPPEPSNIVPIGL